MGWPQIVFGVLLVVALLFLSLFYAQRQVRALRKLRFQSTLSAEEVRYEHAKAWRRLISCGLTLVLACLLATALVYLEAPAQALADARADVDVGEALTPDQRHFARLYGWYWIVFLLVLLLVVLLAAIDLWSTRRYALREKRKLHADRRAMIERQVTRMREEHRQADEERFMHSPASVRTGLDVLRDQGFAPLRNLTVGLVTHPAAIDARFHHAADLLAAAPGLRLAALFGPEHGLFGQAQDLIGVPGESGPARGLRAYSLYGDSFASLRPTAEQLRGLDALVIDLQDVGSRYYTFQATMLLCLESASEHGLLTVVLDRPNPLGGEGVEDPTLRPGFESFVGLHPIATRHGLTMGELARLYRKERGLTGELLVVPCEGWRRDMHFAQTGLPWVLPSPNMPTVETALVYPGQCLLEGTNLSEGRGTTRPFELCGAPWVDARALCRRLEVEGLPGVVFRPAHFRPTFHKFAGVDCGGTQIHVLDPAAFLPVRTGLAVLAALHDLSGERFAWRAEPYEFVADRPAIDLLFGSDRERIALEAGRAPRDIAHAWETEEEDFRRRRREFFLYEGQACGGKFPNLPV